jgi:hypothetical protein
MPVKRDWAVVRLPDEAEAVDAVISKVTYEDVQKGKLF